MGERRAARRPTVSTRRRAAGDRRALACLLLAVLVLLAGLALTLSRTAERRTGTNGVWLSGEVPPLRVNAGLAVCQGGELLPAGTSALRIPLRGPRVPVLVALRRGGRVFERVHATLTTPRGALDGAARAPIAPPAHDLDGVEVCLRARSAVVILRGAPPPEVGLTTVAESSTGTSIPIDYLARGSRSWWAQASTIADRLSLGRGDWGGRWVVWLLGALVLGSLGLTARVVLRTVVGDRPLPALAATIAAIAALNATAWSIVTPAFQVPDEVAHVAYVQRIGETGGPPPSPHHAILSAEQSAAMTGSRFGAAHEPTIHTAVWSPLQQRRLLDALHAGPSRVAVKDIGDVEPEPPLYYALEAIPYRLASSVTLLDRMMAMRLLSALMAGATALFALLFVRECLPARPWAWSVGGLGVAFTPMLGFISGGVNPDALLYATSAALLFCLARAFRRGVATRLVAWIGALLAVGSLAKVNFAGLVPGALLALALAARRSEGGWNRAVARALGTAVAIGAVPFALVSVLEAVAWGRPFAIGRPRAPESHVGLGAHLSYVWQVFLPRLPGQRRLFAEYPAYEDLFKTFVGAFGWIVARFPSWVYRLAVAVFALLGWLAGRALSAHRRELRQRRAELLGYASILAVLLLLVALSADLRRDAEEVVQGRYLLPLLPLFGALLALAARGAGERWGRAVGAAIVVAAVAWTVFGQLVTIAFFYS
jgi:hypothetical protein